MNRSDIFGGIYAGEVWGDGVNSPKSGIGSDPRVARPYVAYVMEQLSRRHVRSVVDVGHGDWEMWPDEAFRGIDYRGLDCATGLSQAVNAKRGGERRTFSSSDAVSMLLPDADALLCKDVLQHLSDDDVRTLLEKFRKYPLVVISHDVRNTRWTRARIVDVARAVVAPRHLARSLRARRNPYAPTFPRENDDIGSGGYRPVNLERDPWRFQEVGMQIVEAFDFPCRLDGRRGLLVKRVWLLEPISAGQ